LRIFVAKSVFILAAALIALPKSALGQERPPLKIGLLLPYTLRSVQALDEVLTTTHGVAARMNRSGSITAVNLSYGLKRNEPPAGSSLSERARPIDPIEALPREIKVSYPSATWTLWPSSAWPSPPLVSPLGADHDEGRDRAQSTRKR
jgi:hypothetical protein